MSRVTSAGTERAIVREDRWHRMHQNVGDKLQQHVMRSAQCSALPCTVLRIFLSQNPVGAILVHCNFMSSSLRTLFFMTEISGALMLACLFFEASGIAKRGGVDIAPECSGDGGDGVGEKIGRLLAVGVTTMVLATIPSMFLGSLHSRSFKKYEFEGCPAWNRQLRRWRVQDRTIWIFGLLYCTFCVFFVVLFLANVAPEDHEDWAVAGLIATVQDTILIPFCVALITPSLAFAAISIVSAVKKIERQDLVHEMRVEILRSHSVREGVELIGSV